MDWFLIAIGVAAVLGALYWRWMRRIEAELAEGAEFEWSRLRDAEPELLEGLDRTAFDAIYRRVNFPRFPGYALACFIAFVVSLPVSFALLAAGIYGAAAIGLTPESVDVANRYLIDDGGLRFFKSTPPEAALYLVRNFGGFYYFFGVLFIWLLIVAFFMHRYHARRPGYLRDEILRTR